MDRAVGTLQQAVLQPLLKKTIRPVHSIFAERTNLSAYAFKFGAGGFLSEIAARQRRHRA
jgi:hypothetical protein